MALVVSDNEIETLEHLADLRDHLTQPITPAERLTTLERMATLYAVQSAKSYGKAWDILLTIQTEGLWRLVRENGCPKYREFYDYATEFWESVKSMSRATIARRTAMANVLILQLGVNPDMLSSLMEDKPAIAGELLQTGTDRMSGNFCGFDDEHRTRVAAELGYKPEDVLPSDNVLMKELMERTAEASHQDAGEMASRIKQPINIYFTYNAREDVVCLVGNGREASGKHITFCYEYRRAKPDPLHKKARDWLLTKIRPDARKVKGRR